VKWAIEFWNIPLGHDSLADIVREYGREQAQTNLMSGQWSAFKYNPTTGDLEQIPATVWCAARGHTWLEAASNGEFFHFDDVLSAAASFAVIVRTPRRPSWTDSPKDADGPKVLLAKKLMAAVFPQGEWRQMSLKAVRKSCESEATKRQVQLPSPDSFSRAMGRRHK
jgi:hypothetical protein